METPWNSMEIHGIPWNSMDFHGIPWSSTGLFYTGVHALRRPSISATLERHPHSLAGSNFHGHNPAIYSNQHLLWGLMSIDFGTLALHPVSPVVLTKNGLVLGTRILSPASVEQVEHLTNLKFENRLRLF